jgi:tripartite ATP-independent transporter DctP family solute receptor
MRVLRRLGPLCLPLLALAPIAPTPAAAAPVLMSVDYDAAPQSPQNIGADSFRRTLLARAGGRLALDERGGESLGSELSILQATQGGAVDMAVLSGSVVSGVVPELGVFDIPFLFRDTAQAKAVAEGPVAARIAAKFAAKGLVLLAIGKQGFRNVTNSVRPIRSPADLRGLRIRVIPNAIYQMSFKALGATVVPMDFPLVYPALKDRRIDGQENPIVTIEGTHFENVQKYLSLTRHFFAAIVFIANRDSFERLDPADQAVLRAAARAGADATWQDDPAATQRSLAVLRAGGMQILEQVDRQPFIDAVKPLEPEFDRRFGKDLIAAIRATP